MLLFARICICIKMWAIKNDKQMLTDKSDKKEQASAKEEWKKKERIQSHSFFFHSHSFEFLRIYNDMTPSVMSWHFHTLVISFFVRFQLDAAHKLHVIYLEYCCRWTPFIFFRTFFCFWLIVRKKKIEDRTENYGKTE